MHGTKQELGASVVIGHETKQLGAPVLVEGAYMIRDHRGA
jgi:hypothetical protein